MPSAGRPFTRRARHTARRRGVLVAPVALHTGVSSPELRELPYPERYRVPETTARVVNSVHGWGGRVIAVGTTVVRALESVVDGDGVVRAGEGWTERRRHAGARVFASSTVSSAAGTSPRRRTCRCSRRSPAASCSTRSYRAARERGYLWHEFGDVHLILP